MSIVKLSIILLFDMVIYSNQTQKHGSRSLHTIYIKALSELGEKDNATNKRYQTDGRTLVTFGRPQNLKVLKRLEIFSNSQFYLTIPCVYIFLMLQTKKEKLKRNTTTKNAYFILHFLLSYNEFRVDIIKTLLACNTLKI